MASTESLEQGPQPALSEDTFQTEQSKKLFEAIDELRNAGANNHIDLPQLVLVGDQSAGKSSLLQSLTDVPFPVARHLCTRFPTHIISRRTSSGADITEISIRRGLQFDFGYGPTSAAPRFEKQIFPVLTAEDFKNAIQKASVAMGITASTAEDNSISATASRKGSHNFSCDTLVIEISGPNRSHFSIIDVPGIFQSPPDGLTEKEMDGVREMVESHMRSPLSIIICVASGTNEIANQAVFNIATKLDPKRERTLGVITKCDITQDVDQVCKMAQNKSLRLNHGWFCVSNRTPSEIAAGISSQQLLSREKELFVAESWKELNNSDRCGTQALKRYLARLLCQRIQDTFPAMLSTLKALRSATEDRIDGLGPSRDTPIEERSYLMKIAEAYHSLASTALDGRYNLIESSNLKLRRIIRDANDEFASQMELKGHSLPFSYAPVFKYETPKAIQSQSIDTSTTSVNKAGSGLFGASANSGSPGLFGSLGVSSTPTSFPSSGTFGLSNGSSMFGHVPPNAYLPNGSVNFFPSKPSNKVEGAGFGFPSKASKNIYDFIRTEIKESKGTELQGTLNPDVLPILFHKQASGWKDLSQNHFDRITKLTLEVLTQILQKVCADENVRTRIQSLLSKANEHWAKLKRLQLDRRLHTVLTSHLQTNNFSFEAKIKSSRLRRFQAALGRYQESRLAVHRESQGGGGLSTAATQPAEQSALLVIDMRDTEALFNELHMGNSKNLEDEIHDILEAYYAIAKDDFIKFVNTDLIESYLQDKKGPVYAFSQSLVGSMTDPEIHRVAAEDEVLVYKRAELDQACQRLDRAIEIATRYSGYY